MKLKKIKDGLFSGKKCPVCGEEMIVVWTVEFNFLVGITHESECWDLISDNVKESFLECLECDIRIYDDSFC